MKELKDILEKYINQDFIQAVISNPRNSQDGQKMRIRPVLLKEELVFQASEYRQKKVYHQNLKKDETVEKILEWMLHYRQLELFSGPMQVQVLISKRGKATIKEKRGNACVKQADLSHNRKKNYILDPQKKVPFLVDLGVQTKEGRIVHAQYDKFRQINRFLEFIEDVLPQLSKEQKIHILDFGCGKSYLTFAMYYYLRELKGYEAEITGLDLKDDVIDRCSRLAESYGYEGLTFLKGDIADYDGADKVDMVVTLHACDTATDYALDKAVRWGAEVILSVPCCQHELNGQMENEILAPVFQYGLIRERMAALFTDALRAQILESRGYDVQILEFIDMEHTPKNILIRAVKSRKKKKENYKELMEFLHVHPTLAALQQEGRTEEHE